MSFEYSEKMTEVLASRFCHDLINPISAIANGVELIEDGDTEMVLQVANLLTQSSKRAMALLQFFRFAFGSAGAEKPTGSKDLLNYAQELYTENKIVFDWQIDLDKVLAPGNGKIILLAVMICAEALPRGGTIIVKFSTETKENVLFVQSQNNVIKLNPEIHDVIYNNSSNLTPRTLPLLLLNYCINKFLGKANYEIDEKAILLKIILPSISNDS
ncbi:MAG: hypothetical protein K1X44_01090 [Alphaproteobacteria bacterium]|nr:hypothetical protein [Alphaproteobacteria bacterium]